MTSISRDLSPPSVLLVEPCSESREVLATALQLRGLRIFEADEPRRGLELARTERPDVIILDFDQPVLDADLHEGFASATKEPHDGLILLGDAPPPNRSSRERFIARPFHFGPLVETVERLVSHAKAA